MKARGDARIDSVIEQAVRGGPLDMLEIRDALVRAAQDLIAGREGLIHAAILRGVRRGALRVDGTSERGLARYGPMTTGEAAVPPELHRLDPQDPEVHRARRIASTIRNEATRERVTADVAAHRRALRNSGALRGFGPTRQLRHLLRRVDRGRSTVLFTQNLGDMAKKVLIHEGPWILAALVAFLLIRSFVAEVFVIPSASMLPTLDLGDRVVVFKPGGRERPRRWTILTFKRAGTTYVKRAVGLGGEQIALIGGDVFIDGSLTPKPPPLRAALRAPYAAWRLDGPAASEAWILVEEHDVRDGEGVVREERWGYDGPSLWSSGPRDGGPGKAGDVPLRDAYAALVADRDGDAVVGLDLVYRAVGRGGFPDGPIETRYSLEVREDGARLEIFDGAETVRVLRQPGRFGDTVTLELSYVDGILVARAGDVRWEEALPPTQRPPLATILAPRLRRRGTVDFREIRLDADLHYTSFGQLGVAPSLDEAAEMVHAYRIPDGHVFFLGDNTTNSNDSRRSEVGAIPEADLIGPVRFRIWPPARVGGVP